jgi:hypothetical protein
LTTHPVMQSFEPGEFWAYCYVDETIVDNIGDRLARSHR